LLRRSYVARSSADNDVGIVTFGVVVLVADLRLGLAMSRPSAPN
jgi:hypothetical protein